MSRPGQVGGVGLAEVANRWMLMDEGRTWEMRGPGGALAHTRYSLGLVAFRQRMGKPSQKKRAW